MKLLGILLLIIFSSSIIYWAFTDGDPVYMRDLNGNLRRIPGMKSNRLAIVVIILFTVFGIILILSNY